MSKFSLDHINVASIHAYFDDKTCTKVKETVNLLQYESQHFRCKVHIEFFESIADHNWSIGLVQACDNMYLENKYGSTGSSFWEFHPLRSGRHKMVNDSDGRQYPFYSLTSSKCEVRRGLVQDSELTLQFEDHFYPTVAWDLPYGGGAKLTEVIRRQDFWVWLVAIKRRSISDVSYSHYNLQEDKLFVLKSMRWRYHLHMAFDTYQQVGKRLRNIDDIQTELPYILDTEETMPISALTPPHCNAAQSLLWYPRNCQEKPKLLVPPRQIIVPWDTWLKDMVPLRPFTLQKPKDCKIVGEWNVDESIGTPASVKELPKTSRRTSWSKCRESNECLRKIRRHSTDLFQRR